MFCKIKDNNKIKHKKIFNLIVLGIALLSFFMLSGFGDVAGIGNIVFDPTTDIAPSIVYRQQLAISPTRGIEHAYEIEGNLTQGDVVPFVYTGSLTSAYKLSTMASNLTNDGYKVIAGVNGDFFSTNDNTTLGINLHNGYIYSTGSNEKNAIAFNSDGTAFVGTYSFEIPMTVNHTKYVQKETGEIDQAGNPVYVTEAVYEELSIPISYINETMGAGEWIHLYNNRFSTNTKTKKNCVEVVINTSSTSDPSFHTPVTGTISYVKSGTSKTPIGPNQVVLSIANTSSNAWMLSQLTVGDTVSILVKNTSPYRWDDVTEAIGAHDLIAKDGAMVSSATSASPRTCIGVKPDGSIIIYAVDGRQSSFSNGLSLSEIGQYLLEKGCSDVVNLDGGGSTSVMVRMPGDAAPSTVNKPSDGSLRSVSNGLFLVAKVSASSGTPQNITMYPRQQYVLAGGNVQMSLTATDEKYLPASMPSGTLEYSTDDSESSISASGLFTARKGEKNVFVTAKIGDMSSTSFIHVIENASFSLNTSSVALAPKAVTDINVKAVSYMYNSIIYDDSCFTWSCDPNIGTIDTYGVFTAADSKYETGNIYVTFGNSTTTVPVTVGTNELFSDISKSWAKEYIVELAKQNIISGMGDGTFAPNASVTRAQFVKLLAGAVGAEDFSTVASAGFTDVSESSWFAPYVNWASHNNIVKGMGDGKFAPDATITREQMAIMINNLATASEIIYTPITEYADFYDEALIHSWASDQIKNVVMAGIMSGKPYNVKSEAGNVSVTVFDPSGFATRAESAKVIYMTRNLLKDDEE